MVREPVKPCDTCKRRGACRLPLSCARWLRYLRESSQYREDMRALSKTGIVRQFYAETLPKTVRRQQEELAREYPWIQADAADSLKQKRKEESNMNKNMPEGEAVMSKDAEALHPILSRIQGLLDLRRPEDTMAARSQLATLATTWLRDALEQDAMANERAKIERPGKTEKEEK